MLSKKKQTKSKSVRAKKTVSVSKKTPVRKLAKTRPTKKELKEVTERTMKKFSIAIEKLSRR